MLFDRFDNMRSKIIGGGGEGYDLTRIGSSVTVNARINMAIGSAFEGQINNEFYQKSFKQQTIGITDIKFASVDRKILCKEKATNNTITIYILNELGNYEPITITDSRIKNDYMYLNNDGTLLVAKSTTGSNYSIVCEINKENKELNIYEVQFAIGTVSPIDNIILSTSPSTKLYMWDFTNHVAIPSTNSISFSAGNYWILPTNKIISYITNNVWTCIYLTTYNYNALLYKMTFDLSNFASTIEKITLSPSFGQNKTPRFSIDENHIIAYDSSNLYVFDFNKYTLNYILQHTIPLTSLSSPSITDYTLLTLDNNILMINNNFYDVTDWNNIQLITTFTTDNAELIFQWKTFINNFISVISSNSYINGFPNDTTSHYYIEPYSGTIQSNKIYGITSKALQMGENGNAQMLFSTYIPVP